MYKAPGGAVGTAAGGTGVLAYTGFPVGWWALAAVAMLAVGLTLLLLTRRRKIRSGGSAEH